MSKGKCIINSMWQDQVTGTLMQGHRMDHLHLVESFISTNRKEMGLALSNLCVFVYS